MRRRRVALSILVKNDNLAKVVVPSEVRERGLSLKKLTLLRPPNFQPPLVRMQWQFLSVNGLPHPIQSEPVAALVAQAIPPMPSANARLNLRIGKRHRDFGRS
jgi:hypothetical protein